MPWSKSNCCLMCPFPFGELSFLWAWPVQHLLVTVWKSSLVITVLCSVLRKLCLNPRMAFRGTAARPVNFISSVFASFLDQISGVLLNHSHQFFQNPVLHRSSELAQLSSHLFRVVSIFTSLSVAFPDSVCQLFSLALFQTFPQCVCVLSWQFQRGLWTEGRSLNSFCESAF